ncbi:MAG: DUF2167 domain-containing protein [Azoarcus sp.]|jgi:uncharacterized membrane-anchored protein|nr:DUF2167 domain-containing protein [Azoarcus sp.]
MFPHAARKDPFHLYSIVAAFLLLCLSVASHAQDTGAEQEITAAEQEIQAAAEAMWAAAVQGPKNVALDGRASIDLPEKFAFAPKAEAGRFMRAIGNRVSNDFIGLILGEQLSGFVVVAFSPEGYIKDDDAKDWNVDELLQSLKDGTEQSNKERVKRGLPEIAVLGWIEKPAYDAGLHHLAWSISSQSKNAPEAEKQGVNYNTYLLGREGYLSLNLVTDVDAVEGEKTTAKQLLAAVSFNNGQRYEDFNAATDRVSEYGLAALIGGLAAKKLGLLAVIGVFLLKAWKIVLIGLLAVAAIAKRVFRRG